MSQGYYEYKKIEKFKAVTKSELLYARNYICLQLNAGSPGSYPYYYDLYSYAIKCSMVIDFAKEHNLVPATKLGEAICNDKIVNFLKEDKHKKCTCGSVYYKAVF